VFKELVSAKGDVALKSISNFYNRLEVGAQHTVVYNRLLCRTMLISVWSLRMRKRAAWQSTNNRWYA